MRNINRLNKEKFSFGIKDIIKDALIALAVCLILYLISHQTFIFVLFIPFSIAAIIGDLVRKCTRPDAISTKGKASKVLNNIIYWYIGPQIEAIIISLFLLFIFLHILGKTSSSENQQSIISNASQAVTYRD